MGFRKHSCDKLTHARKVSQKPSAQAAKRASEPLRVSAGLRSVARPNRPERRAAPPRVYLGGATLDRAGRECRGSGKNVAKRPKAKGSSRDLEPLGKPGLSKGKFRF